MKEAWKAWKTSWPVLVYANHGGNKLADDPPHINSIGLFCACAKPHLTKHENICKEMFYLHLKEMELRFNHRCDNLCSLSMKSPQEQPIEPQISQHPESTRQKAHCQMKKNQHKELMEKVPSGNLTPEEKLSLAKDLLSALSSEWSISHQKNFADNLLFLMSIKNNLLENENDPEILWRCIKSFGILGAKSKNQECKDFCFSAINKFKDDSNKKISYFANFEIICRFGEGGLKPEVQHRG